MFSGDRPEHLAEILDELRAGRNMSWDRIQEWTTAYGRARNDVRRYAISESFRYNLRKGVFPSIGQLESLSALYNLTYGSLPRAVGMDLDTLFDSEMLVNAERTRPIYPYAFRKSCLVPLPTRFAPVERPCSTLFLKTLIPAFDYKPIREVEEEWRVLPRRYLRMGMADDVSYPNLVPGSIIQYAPAPACGYTAEDLKAGNFFVVQHPLGYSCCRCALADERLHLLATSESRSGPQDYRYPGEAQLLGKATAMFAAVGNIDSPLSRSQAGISGGLPTQPLRGGNELIRGERLRASRTIKDVDQLGRMVSARFPYGVSGSHANALENRAASVPCLRVALGLCAVHSIFYGTLLRTYGFEFGDAGRWDLEEVLSSPSKKAEGSSVRRERQGEFLLRTLLEQWGEIPAVLFHSGIELTDPRLLYFGDSEGYLDPLIKPHAFLLLDALPEPGRRRHDIVISNGVEQRRQWLRPIYAFQVRSDALNTPSPQIVCSYAMQDRDAFVLIPHPENKDQRRRSFQQHKEAELLGRVIGVASLL